MGRKIIKDRSGREIGRIEDAPEYGITTAGIVAVIVVLGLIAAAMIAASEGQGNVSARIVASEPAPQPEGAGLGQWALFALLGAAHILAVGGFALMKRKN